MDSNNLQQQKKKNARKQKLTSNIKNYCSLLSCNDFSNIMEHRYIFIYMIKIICFDFLVVSIKYN